MISRQCMIITMQMIVFITPSPNALHTPSNCRIFECRSILTFAVFGAGNDPQSLVLNYF